VSPAVLFLSSAALGVACTRAAVAVAPRLGMVSAPNRLIPQHTRTVAYLGGVAVFVAAAVVVAGAARLAGPRDGALPWGALAGGAAAFLLVGLWDDWRPLSPAAKLAWQAVAGVGAAAAGLRLPLTGSAPADAALAALWIVAVVNAANLADVCDGLLGCVAVAAFAAAGLTRPAVLPMVLPVAGATAGFLVYNLPPARVFLGDAGSHLLGFLLAGVALAGARGVAAWPALPWMALVAGVPLFELVFLIVVRTRKGLPWWRGSPDHFALRLQAAGLTRGGVDAVAVLAAAVLAAAGAALLRLPAAAGVPLACAVLLALAGAGWVLLRWEPPRAARP
jgi:UDP-GlcNAc:undecaprenyl-phosphate GlcNAc-1-phosphate transferase